MFKELGAFIDEVGCFAGRAIKEMLSDKDDKDDVDGLTGDVIINPDIDFEESDHVVIVGDKEQSDNTIFLDD